MWPLLNVRIIESQTWNWGMFWQASSAIATSLAVLIALLTPVFSRCSLRKKVITSCNLLIRSVEEISELAAGCCKGKGDEAAVELFHKSSILKTKDFKIWDMYSHDFAKFEPEKYIVFLKIVSSAKSIQESALSWENCILQKLDGNIEDFFSDRFRNRIIDLATTFDLNMEKLQDWGIL